MTTTLAISQYFSGLAEVRAQFPIEPAIAEDFFLEWQTDLPELTIAEKERCDQIKHRYLYHRDHGPIGEGLVNQIAIAPLLEIAGFYDAPYQIDSEYPVQIKVEEDQKIYRGRIDTIVIQKKLWILVIESKGTSFNIEEGMAQALAYMLASPNQIEPTFGFISNGGFSIFLKVKKREVSQYAFSDDFSLYRRKNELYEVLGTFKNIAKLF